MTEHTYPSRMPKDDPRVSVRRAWQILDCIRPGLIPPIARFELAAQIAGSFEGMDSLAPIMKLSTIISDVFTDLSNEQIKALEAVSPGLVEKITFLHALVVLAEK
jgi:hypothetical protein